MGDHTGRVKKHIQHKQEPKGHQSGGVTWPWDSAGRVEWQPEDELASVKVPFDRFLSGFWV